MLPVEEDSATTRRERLAGRSPTVDDAQRGRVARPFAHLTRGRTMRTIGWRAGVLALALGLLAGARGQEERPAPGDRLPPDLALIPSEAVAVLSLRPAELAADPTIKA